MSRKSMRRGFQTFNPASENTWSKDDSKFGQRMLEKMGWKKGEGIGSNGQGISENVKIRCKFDTKGFGFKIKEDEWVGVEVDFSELLSKLSETRKEVIVSKSSLESSSLSSRSRVHYHKFIRGKDISKYSKEDLSGILGIKKSSGDEYNSDDTNDRRITEKKSDVETDLNAVVDMDEVQNGNFVESKPSICGLLPKKCKKAKIVLESHSDFVLPAVEVKSEKSVILESAITDAPSERKNKKKLDVEFNLDESACIKEEHSVVERNSNSVMHYEDVDHGVINMKQEVNDTYRKGETKKRRQVYELDSNSTVSLKEAAENEKCIGPGHTVEDLPKKKNRIKNRIKEKPSAVDLDPGPTVDANESIENEKSIEMEYENSFTKKKRSRKKSSIASSSSDLIIYVDEHYDSEKTVDGKSEIINLLKKKRRKIKSSVKLDSKLIEIVDSDVDNSDHEKREANDPPHETKFKKLKLHSINIDEDIEDEKPIDCDLDFSIPRTENEKPIDCDLDFSIPRTENEKPIDCDLDFSIPRTEKKRRKNKLCVEKSVSNPITCIIDLDAEDENYIKLKTEIKEPTALKNPVKRKSSNVEPELEIENSRLKKKLKKEKPVTQEHSASNIDRSSDTAVNNQSTIEQPTEKDASSSTTKNYHSDLNDFNNFMQKVEAFNSLTDVKAVLQEFEEKKEKLLHRYRQNFIKKYLESANENDGRIYSDLNGDELDCQDAASDQDEVHENTNEEKRIKKARPYLRKLHLSKAERIIYKARLLKSIQGKTFVHNFVGSNLSDIIGYGNEDANS